MLGRLVISAMVGVASLCTLSPEVMTNLTCVRDWGKAIATYVYPLQDLLVPGKLIIALRYSAIMLVLAVVVS